MRELVEKRLEYYINQIRKCFHNPNPKYMSDVNISELSDSRLLEQLERALETYVRNDPVYALPDH